MDQILDVPQGSSPVASEDVKTQVGLPVAPVVTTDKPTPGSHTPESNLLAALKEERAKRKELEDKLNNQTTTPEEIYSDEGRALKNHITSLEAKIEAIEEEKNLERLYSQYPLLREKADEFNEYRVANHPRAKLESVVKLFLVENGLLEPVRRGLESPTGGPRTPSSDKMTQEDIKHLRETDYRKYTDMLKKGLINI